MNETSTIEIGKWTIESNYYEEKENYYSFPWKLDSFKKEKNIDNIKFYFDLKQYTLSHDILDKNKIYDARKVFHNYNVFQDENNDFIWRQDDLNKNCLLKYKINSSWDKINLIYSSKNIDDKFLFEYLGRIFFYSVINYGGIVLHSVLMEYKDKGIIISAPSGIGKTTHARMWRDKERALIINGDRALCRKIDSKWTGFGMPWCGTSGEYINRDVEISAIVVLEQAKENSVEKLDILQAFNHMIPNITAPTWEKNLLSKAMDYLEDMINEIPVYKLKCTPDIEAVELLKKEIDKL